MRFAEIATLDLVPRRIGEIGPMPFARVNDQHAASARGTEYLPAGTDGRLQARHVIAEGGAEAAGLEEVALHVDDQQGGAVEFDRKRRRLRLESDVRHCFSSSATANDLQKQGQHSSEACAAGGARRS